MSEKIKKFWKDNGKFIYGAFAFINQDFSHFCEERVCR